MATVIAGPGVTARLADFGADVIKVELPGSGDSTRNLGWSSRGVSLWWKWLGRNKRSVTLNLSHPKGADLLVRLIESADVLVESFRPGTLERWGLGPERLMERNPALVVLRTSAFGQTGPYRGRPGFGTLAESMSGIAHMTGSPEGPPLLPPVPLADEVSGILGAFAVMVALYDRDRESEGRGRRGQVIDLSLAEAVFQLTGPLAAAYDALGVVPGRAGSRMPYLAPRGAYPTMDGRWVGVTGTTEETARRIFRAIGREDLAHDPRFSSNAARVENADALDDLIQEWTSRRTLSDVIRAFEQQEAPAAPIYDIAQVAADPHYRERGTLVRVWDEELGDVLLPDVQPRLAATPGRVRHAGPRKGSANAEVYGDLGVNDEQLEALRREGVV